MDHVLHDDSVRLALVDGAGGPPHPAVDSILLVHVVERELVTAPLELVAGVLGSGSATGSTSARGRSGSARRPGIRRGARGRPRSRSAARRRPRQPRHAGPRARSRSARRTGVSREYHHRPVNLGRPRCGSHLASGRDPTPSHRPRYLRAALPSPRLELGELDRRSATAATPTAAEPTSTIPAEVSRCASVHPPAARRRPASAPM
jgi:hypothetical protein